MPSSNFEDSWYDVSMRYYYQQLTESEKKLFRTLYQAIMTYEPVTFQANRKYSEDEFSRAADALWHDCPELFQFNRYQYSYSYDSSSHYEYTVSSLEPHCSQTEYARRSERIRAVIQDINRRIPAGADDYDVELACYRYIIEHCDYLIDEPNTTTAYSSIVYGYAQCEGYADGLCLLLRCAGIPCIHVASENHAWNIVKINGAWYQCDATWDDPLGGNYPFIDGQDFYLPHFNIPDRLMLSIDSHAYRASVFSVPVCTDIRESYTCRDGIYIPGGTVDARSKIEDAIRSAYAAGKRKMLIRADGIAEYEALEQCAVGIYSVVPGLSSFQYYSQKPELYCIYFVFE